MRRIFVAFAVIAFLCVCLQAQDDQSLGDLARQVRAQKQQKPSQTKDTPKDTTTPSQTGTDAKESGQPKATHVLTNDDDLGASAKPASASHSDSRKSESTDAKTADQADPAQRQAEAENWKSQIEQQKSSIAELQQQIEQLSSSIHYTGANCVANCEQWNERQQHKQEQVDTMKAQLEELKHHLEEMQETARKQGFGSSVYEP